MTKVSIAGVGRVGSALAYSLVRNPKIDKIVLNDIAEQRVDGTILDVSHAYPQFSHKLEKGGYDAISDSDIIIIIAGVPRSPETKTRMDLLDVNKKIVADIVRQVKFSEDKIVIVATNPVEPLTCLVHELSGLADKNVIGFSNILDSSRLRFILSQKTSMRADKIQALVIGQHGEDMIPLFSQCTINGKRLRDFNLSLEEVKGELELSGKRIVDTLGGTQYGPSTHLANLVDAIVNDTNEMFPVSFYVKRNEFYGLENVCISLPVKINRAGVGDVVELGLDASEKDSLRKLSEKLKEVQLNLIS